jgi:hypothetical protein
MEMNRDFIIVLYQQATDSVCQIISSYRQSVDNLSFKKAIHPKKIAYGLDVRQDERMGEMNIIKRNHTCFKY